VPLLIQKLTTTNVVTTDSEIKQPETVALPIQKSTAINFAAVNSEISSQTAVLPI
jgi:hypothetical protein